MKSPIWNFASASVRGASHIANGTTCQDSNAIRESDDGLWVAMVASDGAGTANKSDVSSKFVAHEFAEALVAIASDLAKRPPGPWVTDAIIEHIVGMRKQLRSMAKSDDISSFHCTLVAALVGPSGGITIHLGDGAVFGAQSGPTASKALDLSQDYLLSLPQNGEYANETVFMTERDWVKHLRIEPLPAVDWLVLGTDGGMALAMVGEKRPKSGFIKPVLEALTLRCDQATRDAAIHNSLSDKQADRLTNDDKTLCAVVRSKLTHVEGAIQERVPVTVVPVPTASLASLNFGSTGTPLFKQADVNVPDGLIVPKSKSVMRMSVSRREMALLASLLMVGVGAVIYLYLNLFKSPSAVVSVTKVRGVAESIPARSTISVQVTAATDKPLGGNEGTVKTERDADTVTTPDQTTKP